MGVAAARPIVIVGGGIIGLMTAYELLRRQRKVVVLEAKEPGSCATQAAGGMLAPTCEAEAAEQDVLQFGLDSLRRYPAYVAELEAMTGIPCGYSDAGTFWVGFGHDDMAELQRVQGIFRHKGLHVERWDSAQITACEPLLSSRLLGGLSIPTDHRVDPRGLVAALLRAIVMMGGDVRSGAKVTQIVARDGRVTGIAYEDRTGQLHQLSCSQAVLAAGAWSSVAFPELSMGEKVRPVKGQVLRLRGPVLLKHVVRTPDVYLVPCADGDLLLGATCEEQGFDTTPTAGAVLDMLRHAWRALPAVAEAEFVECQVGLRPAYADHVPRMGLTPVQGVWISTGHYRDGILMAPAAAHYMADWITTGVMPEALAHFGLDRSIDRSMARAQKPA